ncbi:MAG: acyltransferase family protein [Phycisphaerae bacterium]|jgi:surface polysaccharide O-acyltransferase-like enzyme
MSDAAASNSPDSPTNVATPKPPREAGIEWLRVLACIAIVAFHANPREWPVMIFGLEVFTIFTIALSVQSAGRRSPAAFVKARAVTLLLPWAVWWLAYAGWKSMLAHRAGRDLFSWFEPWRLLAGPETHLWFLPFAFVATVAAGLWCVTNPLPDDARMARRSAVVWSVIASVLLVAASYATHVQLAIEAADGRVFQPWRQWITVLPAAVMGLAIVRCRTREGHDRTSLGMLWSMVLTAAGVSYVAGWTNLALPYVIAITLCMGGLRIRHNASEALLAASGFTFGIFLLHPMLFDVWYYITAKIKLGSAFAIGTHGHAAAMVVFAVVMSGAIVWILRKTPIRRMM